MLWKAVLSFGHGLVDRAAFGSGFAGRLRVDFPLRPALLGAPAAFPLGPLRIAHLLEWPVFLLFALERGPDHYAVCLEPFAERILLDRKQRDLDLQTWLERYVQKLEAHCLAAPPQWFNFYDVWPAEKASAKAAAGGAVPGPGPRVIQENSAGRT